MWLNRLEADHANYREALAWFGATREGEPATRLATALSRFWDTHAHFTEGRRWLEEALALPGQEARTALRPAALNGAGRMALRTRALTAHARYTEALSISQELGDKRGVANALHNLGNTALEQRDYSGARPLTEASLRLLEELNDTWRMGWVHTNLGVLARCRGDFNSARYHHERSFAIFHTLGDDWFVADSVRQLGQLALDQGDYATALPLLGRSQALFHDLGDWADSAILFNYMGVLTARGAGDYASAEAYCQRSLTLFQSLGDRRGNGGVLSDLGYVALGRGEPRQAIAYFRDSLAIHREVGSLWGTAMCAVGIAGAIGAAGQPERGGEAVWGRDGRRRRLGLRLEPSGARRTRPRHGGRACPVGRRRLRRRLDRRSGHALGPCDRVRAGRGCRCLTLTRVFTRSTALTPRRRDTVESTHSTVRLVGRPLATPRSGFDRRSQARRRVRGS